MKFPEYKYLVFSDVYRIAGKTGWGECLKQVVWDESFAYTFWFRTCGYLRAHPWLKYVLFPPARIVLSRLSYRLGISIAPATRIGSGFYIGHFGCIGVSAKSVIGKNCNISPGVILGQANRGEHKGYPRLGDNVYLGPGAKIVGAVTIGNNVAVGANCVVTKDVPDNSVVVGIPGHVISQAGAAGYIEFTDYEDKLR